MFITAGHWSESQAQYSGMKADKKGRWRELNSRKVKGQGEEQANWKSGEDTSDGQ